LAAFARADERLRAEGIRVVAASTDPPDRARETAARLSLPFPVGHGLPLRETAATLGAFYEERRGILHGTGFLLRPDGRVAVALYSSGAIGRLVWQDVVALVQHLRRAG
jgi:peroxiredoxin